VAPFALLALASVVVLVEMAYSASDDPPHPFAFFGVSLDTASAGTWVVAVALCLAAFAACRAMWRHVAPRWAEVGAALAQGGAR
jgi:hypothetical protein